MKDLYIISETACAHDGSVERLKALIDASHLAGCNAVQLQVWNHKDIVTPDHPASEDLKRIELSEDEWRECFQYANTTYPNLEVIACVGDLRALEFSNHLGASAFKIHTADLGNYGLLDEVARTGKRIDLSIGASTFSEIQGAIDKIKERCQIWLMHGYQLFPTPTAGLNLRYMATLRQAFGLTVGYQDHSPPDDLSASTIPIAAIGSGINVIEKHITDSRVRKGTDHEAALEPEEMRKFVSLCREAALALGDGLHRSFTAEEIRYRKYSKKSIVLSRAVSAGEILSRADLTIMRTPELGSPADSLEEFVGKRMSIDLPRYSILRPNHVDTE